MNTIGQQKKSTQQRHVSRRRFIKAGLATAAFTAASWSRVFGANERIGIGIIGFGLIGRIHARNLKAQSDAQIVGVAETYGPRLKAAAELIGGETSPHWEFPRQPCGKKLGALR